MGFATAYRPALLLTIHWNLEFGMIKKSSIFCCLLMVATISQVHAADLTIVQLKNSTYFIPGWEDSNQGKWVQLKSGEYSRKDPDNPLFVKIVAIAQGPLSHEARQAAAVIYGYNTGGTGFFMMLCAVTQDRGKLKNSDLVDLEDRVKINSLSIKSGKIVVDMLTHGPNDPAPFPTVRKIVTYTLVGNKLVKQ
jgi:hypothetical protein